MEQNRKEPIGDAAEIARQVFGEERAAQIEKMVSEGKARKMIESLSESDRKTVEAILHDPVMLKRLLSSPRAAEGLRKLLGGKADG